MPQTDLSTKIKEIESVLAVKKILNRNADDIKQISKYYRKNRLAYRLFNSHEGFVHMGISETDSFSTTDFYAQAKLIGKAVEQVKASKVLELATGKGATLKYLASKYPSTSFYGIDLPNGQLRAKSKLKNLQLDYGDYHDLSVYDDSTFDVVYVVEALCHAHDKSKVIEEAHRVLRKGGLFIIIDGYFSDDASKLTEDEHTAINLVAKSMWVTTDNQTYEETTEMLKHSGFVIKEARDYSTNIMPSLLRLEATAKRFFKRPKLAKTITKLTSDIVTANAAAGYLMPLCVEQKLFEYRYTLAKKP